MIYNVLEYLESTAARIPEKTAFEDTRGVLRYGELTERAKRLGSYLAARIEAGTPVAVCMEKSCEAITAFMGAVYAGCFYSFLDCRQPAKRLETILAVLKPGIILTEEKTAKAAAALNANCPIVPMEEAMAAEPDEALLAQVRARHVDIAPLYCNFTSGSSGTPKGVVVSHRSTIDFIEVFVPLFGIGEDDVIANQAPLDFDVSVKDIYPALKTGATVELIPKSYFTFLPRLMRLLAEKRVTTLTWAVSALCIISTMKGLEFCFPAHIRRVMFSGEVMPPNHLAYWRSFYPDALFVNLYGPTEITCNCTYHVIEREYGAMESIPIGRPFPNEKVFLLSEENTCVTGPDETGELCVSGTALALGYYNDPERTAKAFVQNPLNAAYLEPIYRTGDLARYDGDGLLHYIGRKDFQIKHHGRRIELGEIEAAIGTVPGVTRCCVLYMQQEQRIVAFYSGPAEQSAISAAIRKLLPDYMIPESYLPVSVLPLTKNGKLDRAALTTLWQERGIK